MKITNFFSAIVNNSSDSTEAAQKESLTNSSVFSCYYGFRRDESSNSSDYAKYSVIAQAGACSVIEALRNNAGEIHLYLDNDTDFERSYLNPTIDHWSRHFVNGQTIIKARSIDKRKPKLIIGYLAGTNHLIVGEFSYRPSYVFFDLFVAPNQRWNMDLIGRLYLQGKFSDEVFGLFEASDWRRDDDGDLVVA